LDKDFGARPLKRAIQRYVESALSMSLLRGEFKPGDRVRIDLDGDGLAFTLLERGLLSPFMPQAMAESLPESLES